MLYFMERELLYTLLAVLAVSLISVLAAIPLLLKKRLSKRFQLFMLSLSVGALLAVVFFDFIPHIAEEGFSQAAGITLIAGFLVFFIIERLVHHHHSHEVEKEGSGHSHAYHLGLVNVIGDAIHNFLDGIVIASSFLVNPVVGITATVSVILHEVPQEIADFSVLLYSGYSKKKALLLNFLSALTAIIGAVLVFVLADSVHKLSDYLIPFAAGNFIYIAASNLLPQLHRHCDTKETIEHLAAIILGVIIVLVVSAFAGEHIH
jgi:zinc and cadmium transporter